MVAQLGRDFKIYLGSGGTKTLICGFRSNSLSINNESVDVTDKCSAPYRTLLSAAGIRTMSISGEGFADTSASAKTLQQNAIDDTIAQYTLQNGVGETFVGFFQVTSFERAGDYNTEQTFSVSLESSGQITYTA